VFVTKYSAAGLLLWIRQFGTDRREDSGGISADGLGNVFASGTTFGDLGGASRGSADAFVAKIASPPVPGDFDGDDDVDGADFVAWQINFPTASGATLTQGDADHDGDVDGNDFMIWQSNFPTTAGSAATTIPEPSTLITACFGVLMLALVVRRKSNRRIARTTSAAGC
jgi:hypothetical protein